MAHGPHADLIGWRVDHVAMTLLIGASGDRKTFMQAAQGVANGMSASLLIYRLKYLIPRYDRDVNILAVLRQYCSRNANNRPLSCYVCRCQPRQRKARLDLCWTRPSFLRPWCSGEDLQVDFSDGICRRLPSYPVAMSRQLCSPYWGPSVGRFPDVEPRIV